MVKSAAIPIPPDMYYTLIVTAVSARNQVPNLNSGALSALAPFQHLTNWKPNLKWSLRHKFGDVVIQHTCHRKTKTGVNEPYTSTQTRVCHATLDGASAGEVASRDLNPWKMRPIPLTEDIVSILQQARYSQGCASYPASS